MPSVLLIVRSADSVIVSVSVAVLLAGVGSVTPAGAVTVATLLMLPEAPLGTLAFTVKVTLAPAGRVGTMMPAPCIRAIGVLGTVGHTALPEALPQVTAVTFRLATAGSLKIAALALDGPALPTTIV